MGRAPGPEYCRIMTADDDRDLFRRAIGDVRRLRHARVEHAPSRPPAEARFRRRDERAVLEESINGDTSPTDLETGDDLVYRNPRLSQANYRRLRRGQFAVQDEIDLHGLTADAARSALAEFLNEAGVGGLRCVRVIHGKGLRSGPGGPVIKRRIGRWLRRREDVLAFCSSRPADGGTGALYVLLGP
jgi:DNA-nicking Smr family endonuclease